jgi:hypothetical protein
MPARLRYRVFKDVRLTEPKHNYCLFDEAANGRCVYTTLISTEALEMMGREFLQVVAEVRQARRLAA